MGASHITIEILKHRDKFEASFGNAWRKAEADVKYALRGEGAIVDRIQGNWTVLLATYIALEDVLQLPYSYDDLLKLSTQGILRQNEMSASVDEVAGFWNIISSAIQKGILMKDQDYKIRYKQKLRTSKQKEEMDFEKSIPILMIRRNVMMATYREQGRRMDEQVLPQESMQHYLEITPEYYGYTTSPEAVTWLCSTTTTWATTSRLRSASTALRQSAILTSCVQGTTIRMTRNCTATLAYLVW